MPQTGPFLAIFRGLMTDDLLVLSFELLRQVLCIVLVLCLCQAFISAHLVALVMRSICSSLLTLANWASGQVGGDSATRWITVITVIIAYYGLKS